MAELATIARPYAEALFQACPAKPVSIWRCQRLAGRVAAIAANPRMRQLPTTPRCHAGQLFGLIPVWLKPQRCRTWAQTSCAPSIDNGRVRALPRLRHSSALVNQGRHGSSDAVVTAPSPGCQRLAELGATLESALAASWTSPFRTDEVAHRRRARGGGRRGARHLRQGTSGTNESGPHRLIGCWSGLIKE